MLDKVRPYWIFGVSLKFKSVEIFLIKFKRRSYLLLKNRENFSFSIEKLYGKVWSLPLEGRRDRPNCEPRLFVICVITSFASH